MHYRELLKLFFQFNQTIFVSREGADSRSKAVNMIKERVRILCLTDWMYYICNNDQNQSGLPFTRSFRLFLGPSLSSGPRVPAPTGLVQGVSFQSPVFLIDHSVLGQQEVLLEEEFRGCLAERRFPFWFWKSFEPTSLTNFWWNRVSFVFLMSY